MVTPERAGHGQRDQLDLPPDRHRDRDRRPGRGLLAHGPHPRSSRCWIARAGRRRAPPHAIAGRRVAQGSGAAAGLARLPARARPSRRSTRCARRSSPGLNEIFLIGAILVAGLGRADAGADPQPGLRGFGRAVRRGAAAAAGRGGRRRSRRGLAATQGYSSTPVSWAQAASSASWSAGSDADGSAGRSVR